MMRVYNLYDHGIGINIEYICPHNNTYYCKICWDKHHNLKNKEYDPDRREML